MECYNCGKKLRKKDATREHIPAKAVFAGYGNDFKVNRITVPACLKCNKFYSKFDDALRNAIGVINEDIEDTEAMELTRKAIKSILKKKNGIERIFLSKDGKEMLVKFQLKDFRKIAIKDFKGIFYHEFGRYLTPEWKIEVIDAFESEEEMIRLGKDFFQYLDKDSPWIKSGHHKIFSYKFEAMANDQGLIVNSDDLSQALSLCCIQKYHEKLIFLIIATRKKFLNKRFPLKQYRYRRK